MQKIVCALLLSLTSVIIVSAGDPSQQKNSAASLAAFKKFTQHIPIECKLPNGETITIKDMPKYEGPHIKTDCKQAGKCIACAKEGQFTSCTVFLSNEFVTIHKQIIFDENTLEIIAMNGISWFGGC